MCEPANVDPVLYINVKCEKKTYTISKNSHLEVSYSVWYNYSDWSLPRLLDPPPAPPTYPTHPVSGGVVRAPTAGGHDGQQSPIARLLLLHLPHPPPLPQDQREQGSGSHVTVCVI